jgi:hypothetical protein
MMIILVVLGLGAAFILGPKLLAGVTSGTNRDNTGASDIGTGGGMNPDGKLGGSSSAPNDDPRNVQSTSSLGASAGGRTLTGYRVS